MLAARFATWRQNVIEEKSFNSFSPFPMKNSHTKMNVKKSTAGAKKKEVKTAEQRRAERAARPPKRFVTDSSDWAKIIAAVNDEREERVGAKLADEQSRRDLQAALALQRQERRQQKGSKKQRRLQEIKADLADTSADAKRPTESKNKKDFKKQYGKKDFRKNTKKDSGKDFNKKDTKGSSKDKDGSSSNKRTRRVTFQQ